MSGDPRFRKAFLLALVIGITAAFLYVVSDFLITILVAAIGSGLAQPLYRRVSQAVGGRKALASILTIFAILLLIVGPVTAVLTVVTQEAMRISDVVMPWVTALANEPTRLNAYVDRIPGIDRLAPHRDQLLARFGEAVGGVGAWFVASISSTTRDTLALIVNFFMMLYAMFFFLMDGRRYLDLFARYLPLREAEWNLMIERFLSVARATIKGTLLIAVVQGAMGGFVFALLGIPGAVFWGLVMTVLSVLPVFGGALVWVPVAIVLAVEGEWMKALVLVVFASLVIGSVDNVLRPRLVGRDTRMPDLLILFSTLGGLAVFGAIGFILGPITAALFVTVWQIFGTAYRDELDAEPTPPLQPPPG